MFNETIANLFYQFEIPQIIGYNALKYLAFKIHFNCIDK